MRNVFIVLYMTISCFIGSSQLISMESKSKSDGFKELTNNKFQFTTEIGESVVRTLDDYKLYKSDEVLHAAACKTKALVFGGGHLSAEEAFQLSREYARSGNLDLMFNVGYHGHEGHTVINLDTHSKPDFIEDFTQAGLISRLGLTEKFTIVSIENIRPSLSMNPNTISNAWDALSSGGRVIIYPANLFHQMVLTNKGFLIKKLYQSGEVFKDILSHRNVPFGTIIAQKPND